MKQIILNRVDSHSYFSRALKNLCETKGEELILGYGYISLYIFNKKDFIEAIKRGFEGITKPKIILIGCKDDSYDDYISAAEMLNQKIPSAIIEVYIKDKSNAHRTYHKKIAIKSRRRKPWPTKEYDIVKVLLGSSNLTNGPYNDIDYNQEVDIYMWNSFLISEEEEDKIIDSCVNNGDGLKEIFNRLKPKYKELESIRDTSIIKIDYMINLQLRTIMKEIKALTSNRFSLMYYYDGNNHEFPYIEDKLSNNPELVFETLLEIKNELWIEEVLRVFFNNLYCRKTFDVEEGRLIINEKNRVDNLENLEKDSSSLINVLKLYELNTIYTNENEDKSVYYAKEKEVSFLETLKFVLTHKLANNKMVKL